MSDKILWIFAILMLLDAISKYVRACKICDCVGFEDVDDTEVTE